MLQQQQKDGPSLKAINQAQQCSAETPTTSNNKDEVIDAEYNKQYPPLLSSETSPALSPAQNESTEAKSPEKVTQVTAVATTTPFKDALLHNEESKTPVKNIDGNLKVNDSKGTNSPPPSANSQKPSTPTSLEVEKNTTADDDPKLPQSSLKSDLSTPPPLKKKSNNKTSKTPHTKTRKSTRLKSKNAASGVNTGKRK